MTLYLLHKIARLAFATLVCGMALLMVASSAHAQSGYAWTNNIGRPTYSGSLLYNLTGVTVDASGNFYVLDNYANAVDALDNQGNFLFAFNVSGITNSAQRIARDSTGNFYVSNGNGYVLKFDSRGRYLMQIGSSGNRTGQLSNPFGVTVDSSGNLYVADAGNNRIQKFNAKGISVLKFGAAGTSNGLFNTPKGIAVDGSGNIYVADTGNNRIEKFNAAGTYLLKFGTAGTGNGQFNTATDVAVDSSGNIYVADTGNNRVQKFNASGVFVATVTVDNQAIALDGSGNLYAVYGSGGPAFAVFGTTSMLNTRNILPMSANYLAVDSAGNTYVTDSTNGRLLKFAPTGNVLQNFTIPTGAEGVVVDGSGNTYVSDTSNNQILKYPAGGGAVTAIATMGSGNGQVCSPRGLALDSAGNLYVADYSNSRVQKLSPTGAYLAAFSGSNLQSPNGVQVDISGNVYVTDINNNDVLEFSSAGKFLQKIGASGAGNAQFNTPYDVAVDSSGYIYVSDYSNNRIQKFKSTGTFVAGFSISTPVGLRLDPSGNLLVASGSSITRLSTSFQRLGNYDAFGPNNATLSSPLFLRIDSNGNLYVSNTSSVQKLTNTGASLGSFGTFSRAAGMALDTSGNIYVVDRGANNVQKFNSSLTNIGSFGTYGTSNSQFSSPTGIVLDSSGNLFITDSGNSRVEKFTSSLAYSSQFGTYGTGDGQFMTPSGIALTSTGDFLIADYASNASWVNLFGDTPGFPFLGSFGYYGFSNGLFYEPFDITLDSLGNIYVADQGNGRIQVFDLNANYLFTLGSYGPGSGRFIYPESVALDAVGNIYVVDNGTNLISVFGPIPTLTTLTPTTAPLGSTTLTLAATGSGFTRDAQLTFNGKPLTTTFNSSTSLSAMLPAAQLTFAGTYPVTVLQAAGASNVIPFTVTSSGATLTSLSPNSITAGTPSLAVTVNGSNFVNGALVMFGTTSLPTTFVSSTQLTTTVPGTLLATAGTVAVSVQQLSTTSNTVNFTITPVGPPPTLTGVTPPAADAGSASLTLTLTGTGFTQDAVVNFNGIALTTVFGSSTQLTAILPAKLLLSAGNFPIVVSQVSGTSNTTGFAVNAPAPVITSFSPANARVGSPALTLTLNGLNFTSDVIVSFNNTTLTTTFLSATQVTAALPATLLTTAGVYQVVLTEVGGSSDPVYFAVNAVPPSVTGLSPTAVLHGSAATNLIVTGSSFTADAVISFGGTALTTTFHSATQLTATVPTSMLTTSGFYPVLVKQSSGVSRKVLFIVL